MIAFIFLCVAAMVLGAQSPKPLGWVAIVLATLALILEVSPHLLGTR